MQLIICLLIQYIKGFSNKYYVEYKTQKFRFSFFPGILYGATQTTTTTVYFNKQFVRFKLQVCFSTNSSFLPPQNTVQLMDFELLQAIHFLIPWGKPAQLLSAGL